MKVPFLDLAAVTQELGEELHAVSRRVLDSGWFILGPDVETFEADFASYVEAAHGVGVGSGLAALELSLRALDVGPGGEVLVPAFTYIATWLAVSQVGATPVPVETAPGSFEMDPEALEAAITERTRAAIVVHLYGHPAALAPVEAILVPLGIPLIEDAAQCHGARLDGRRIGSRGAMTCWSFYPGKNLGALGDGGAVTTNDPELAGRLRLFRNYGSPKKYVHDVAGTNSRLDALQAAFLSVKLPYLDSWNDRRRAIADRYGAELAGLDCLLPATKEGCEPVWHLYVIQVPDRAGFQTKLAADGVSTIAHYPIAVHLQGAYAGLGFGEGSFPVTEELHRRVISLPIGPHMTEAQVEQVIASTRSALS